MLPSLRAMLTVLQCFQLCILTLPIIRSGSVEHTTIGSPVYQVIQRPFIHLSIMICSVDVVRMRRYSRKHIDADTGARWSAVSAGDVLNVFDQL